MTPPGNSAVVQYLETVPTAAGDVQVQGGPVVVPAALAAYGADGRAVARLAAIDTSILPLSSTRPFSGPPTLGPTVRTSSRFSAVTSGLSAAGAGAMGIALPILLLATLLAALAYGSVGLRRRPISRRPT